MIKNFLASAVGLRKETATVDVRTYAYFDEETQKATLKAGTVVDLKGKYGVVFNEKDVTDGKNVAVGVVTAGHVYRDFIDTSKIRDFDEETAIGQGLHFESYKVAEYPADDTGLMEEYTPESEFNGGEIEP